MQHKWYNATEIEVGLNSKQIFYIETIEVSRLSALAFLQRVKRNIKENAITGKIVKKLSRWSV